MQIELKSLLRDRGITAIFVTHDQEEAMSVSDRIAVMNAGRIEQFADPSALYARPASPFVMDFVGLPTRIEGTVTAAEHGRLRVDTRHGLLWGLSDLPVGTRVLVGVRPELVSVIPCDGSHIYCAPHASECGGCGTGNRYFIRPGNGTGCNENHRLKLGGTKTRDQHNRMADLESLDRRCH